MSFNPYEELTDQWLDPMPAIQAHHLADTAAALVREADWLVQSFTDEALCAAVAGEANRVALLEKCAADARAHARAILAELHHVENVMQTADAADLRLFATGH